MAWIEYHTELRDHWKIKRLADIMGVNYNEALGTLSCLWLWCVHYAPDGDVTRFKDDELRHASNTNNEKFSATALKNCELIDERNRINDWSLHGIKYLKSARLRTKHYRERLRHRSVTVTPTIPDHTIPNQTIPKDLFVPPPEAVELSNLLKKRILENNPSAVIKNGGWEKEADRLLRIDKRPLPEALEVLSWSQSDSFWRGNILSMGKFRKQYDQLLMKMKNGGNHGRQLKDDGYATAKPGKYAD